MNSSCRHRDCGFMQDSSRDRRRGRKSNPNRCNRVQRVLARVRNVFFLKLIFFLQVCMQLRNAYTFASSANILFAIHVKETAANQSTDGRMSLRIQVWMQRAVDENPKTTMHAGTWFSTPPMDPMLPLSLCPSPHLTLRRIPLLFLSQKRFQLWWS
jgi:hypothetical protein